MRRCRPVELERTLGNSFRGIQVAKKAESTSQTSGDTSREAGQEARCGEGMKQAMSEMIENYGCCEGMMERFSVTRRGRRSPDSPAAKA